MAALLYEEEAGGIWSVPASREENLAVMDTSAWTWLICGQDPFKSFLILSNIIPLAVYFHLSSWNVPWQLAYSALNKLAPKGKVLPLLHFSPRQFQRGLEHCLHFCLGLTAWWGTWLLQALSLLKCVYGGGDFSSGCFCEVKLLYSSKDVRISFHPLRRESINAVW